MSIASKSLDNRSALRQRRRSLSARQQRHAATAISRHLRQLQAFQRAQRIAYYLANDGEISPHIAIDRAEKRGQHIYLPVLHPLKHNRLYFTSHRNQPELCTNRFGIAEPRLKRNPVAPVWTLDIILLPLVGFDRYGNRMGMGGGFYDRTLARLNNSDLKRPLLIGLAHHCQEVEQLQAQNWDIPLDIIATDRELICIKNNIKNRPST
ncbi:MAG: 5-formyltetrahydrofolate cyclo-ligase [Gammaproteobacteria bacterium]|nr:5-formyltetrahydrofolate cyclo-ligase [Gammaproteobacteria bacterium]MBQ0839175.1 5-formyltetrahydrofolate cyclo-ligase [Gammaproteobacteria bacterium]